MLKLKKTKDGHYEFVEDYSMPAMPYALPPHHGSGHQNLYVLNGSNLKESLAELIEAEEDASIRYGDSSPSSMLKSIAVRETLESLELNPDQRFEYLEQKVSEEIDSGNYIQGLRDLPEGEESGYRLPLLDRLETLPQEQHSLYLSTGMYVQNGSLFTEGSYKSVANLSDYVAAESAA